MPRCRIFFAIYKISILLSLTLLGPALASAATGTNTPQKNTSAVKRAAAAPEIPKLTTLRPWEIRRLTAAQKLNYYRALQTFVTTIEHATFERDRRGRNALQLMVLPFAVAMPRSGDDCVIGGYISTWYRKEDGRLSCAVPKDEQIFDVTGATTGKKTFFCGEPAARTAYCNSAVFLFSNESNERSCQPLENFSQNCQKAFESRYGRPSGDKGDPSFPQRLTADFERFSRSMNPDDLNSYYGDFDKFLNKLIEDNTFDKKTAETIRNQVSIMNKTKALASAFPADPPIAAATAAPAGATAPPTTPPAGPQVATGNPAAPPPAISGDDGPRRRHSAKPRSGTAASAGEEPPGDEPGPGEPPVEEPQAVDPEQADNPLPQAQEESKLLGKELSCVRDGLAALGHKPSERFLALIGTGIQAANGAYDSNQETARKSFQMRAISMVQAYGFCDEASYPSNKLKPNELQLARRWMNADGGKAQPKLGLSYLQQMTDPAAIAARSFYDVYGLRTATKETPQGANPDKKKRAGKDDFDQSVEEAFAVFVQSEKNWSEQSLPDRQKHIHGWSKAKALSDFEKCHNNAQERREKEDAFRLQALRLPPAGSDGKRPPLSDDQKTEMARVLQATRKTCESMASACAVDAGKTCGTAMQPGSPLKPSGLPTQPPPPPPPGTSPSNPGRTAK